MTVSTVIVNYGSSAFLPSLVADLVSDPNVSQILIVDNSGEVSGLPGLRDIPNLEIIPNEVNRGFGAGVNQAIEKALGEWILVLNPDMRLGKGCLQYLLDGARLSGSPLVGPRFYWDDRKSFRLPPATGSCLWLDVGNKVARGSKLDAELFSFYWTLRHERFWAETDPFFEPFLSGGGLLIRKDWIGSLGSGLFDERFFLYYEDTDLCVRALEKGFRPLCIPRAHAIHYYDQSPSPSSAKADFLTQAHGLFMEKHYERGMNISFPDVQNYRPFVIDQGDIQSVPVFEMTEGSVLEDCYFEIAVNPYFVPFAQAFMKAARFEIPEDIWDRLSRGQYYSRVRSRLRGTLKTWIWRKL
jgi:GT2 family glycosyltransferase